MQVLFDKMSCIIIVELNFNEIIFSLRYQATKRLFVQSNLYLISTGEDIDTTLSYGNNVLIPNTKRVGDYGNHIGQGVATDIIYWSTSVQYELSSGVFLNGQYVYRKKTSAIPARNLMTNHFQFGVRYNMARREEVF